MRSIRLITAIGAMAFALGVAACAADPGGGYDPFHTDAKQDDLKFKVDPETGEEVQAFLAAPAFDVAGAAIFLFSVEDYAAFVRDAEKAAPAPTVKVPIASVVAPGTGAPPFWVHHDRVGWRA